MYRLRKKVTCDPKNKETNVVIEPETDEAERFIETENFNSYRKNKEIEVVKPVNIYDSIP
jgi:hypothetical protein